MEETNLYTRQANWSITKRSDNSSVRSAKRRQKDPISKEKDENDWKQRGHQESYKSTLPQKFTMNTRGSEKGVGRSITTTEWSEEIDMAEEASDMRWSGRDPTT